MSTEISSEMISPLYPLVSIRKLEWLLGWPRLDLERLASRAGRFYSARPEPKSSGGVRILDRPFGPMKVLQGRIYKRILSEVRLPPTMVGSVPGYSIGDNARFHVAKAEVVRVDLRDCFSRTSDVCIYKIFTNYFGCSKRIASLLTRLVTLKRRLPQGTSTSPMLANLALLDLHNGLLLLASRRNLSLSQWVDDISLSGVGAVRALEETIRLIQRHGHAVKRSKIIRMPRWRRQWVTGCVVNAKISAGRARIRTTRNSIAQCPADDDVMRRSLLGTVHQIRQVCRSQGDALLKVIEKGYPDHDGSAASP